MKLIVGLGNYPKEYELTRHNIGFLFLNYLQEKYNFENWNESKKLLCDISKGRILNEDCLLVKPNTFMNLSGNSVMAVMNFYKINFENIIVVHDELDLKFTQIKYTNSRNSAGHNGVKSINSHIKQSYNRIRIGIGRPENKEYDISNYVLSKFVKEEQEKFVDIFNNVLSIILDLFNTKH